MSKQNVILKITVTEETVRVKMDGRSSSMSAGLAEAMDGDKNLEEVISVALTAVKFRKYQEENKSELAKRLEAILAGMKKMRDSPEEPDKKDGPY